VPLIMEQKILLFKSYQGIYVLVHIPSYTYVNSKGETSFGGKTIFKTNREAIQVIRKTFKVSKKEYVHRNYTYYHIK
jgi:hypothetical protein